jgi:CRP-like cAMP-binding protein
MTVSTPVRNQLLETLSKEEFERLRRRLQPVPLPRGRILYDVGDNAGYVYFPISGVVSLLSITESGEMVEVGMVGKEGTTCIPVITHQQHMPYRLLIQIAGEAVRIEAKAARDEFLRGGRFHHLLICHTHSLFAQIAQSAVCNRFHMADARFCRWLLEMHDRVESNDLQLTHEIVSNMLGVERAHVSRTARALQKAGLISYRYGEITIRNRNGLEAAACECYRVVKQTVTDCLAA